MAQIMKWRSKYLFSAIIERETLKSISALCATSSALNGQLIIWLAFFCGGGYLESVSMAISENENIQRNGLAASVIMAAQWRYRRA